MGVELREIAAIRFFEKDENQWGHYPSLDGRALINNGEGDILMKGLLPTDKYMRAILNKERGLCPPNATLSHVAVIENPAYHKLLIVGDVAIIPLPDLKQKQVILRNLVNTAKAIGIAKPKVALICATEQMLAGMQACVDAHKE